MEPLGSWTAAQTQRSFPSKSSKRHFWAKQRKRKYHLQQAERDGRHDAPEVSVGASLAGNGVDSENSEKAARLHAESTLARTLDTTIDASKYEIDTFRVLSLSSPLRVQHKLPTACITD